MKASEQQTSLIALGTAAYARIMKTETWQDWLAVGRAIEAGKLQTMRELRTNNPQGRVWSEKFGAWLKQNGKSDHNPGGFAAIDAGDRSRLQNCMDHIGEIELFLQSVGAQKAQMWQHPTTVWRQFSKSLKPKAEKAASPAAAKARGKDNLEMSVERLEQVADQLEVPKQLAFDLSDPEAAVETFLDYYGSEAAEGFLVELERQLASRAKQQLVKELAARGTAQGWPEGTVELAVEGYTYRVVDGKEVSVQKTSKLGKPYYQRVKDQRRIARVLKAAQK